MAKKRTIELTIAGYTFSLKNLKVHNDMSDETPCFSADLYCNNKKVAYCKNEGQGGMTDVYRPITSMPAFPLYRDAMNAISNIRDSEYEKEVNALCKQYSSVGDVAPFVQYWTPDHLAEQLMLKQAAWDDAVKQMKKFAKKFPSTKSVWYNGVTYAISHVKDAQPVRRDGREFENVTQWVL